MFWLQKEEMGTMTKIKRHMKAYSIILAAALIMSLTACGKTTETDNSSVAVETVTEESADTAESSASASDSDSTKPTETYEDSSDGGHAIEVDDKTEEYTKIEVIKTGDSDGDEADFYGENAAIFATSSM